MSTSPDIAAVQRTGYDANFVGSHVGLPTSTEAEDSVTVDGSPVVHYTRFSLSLSKSRKLCRWVAWNIDGSSLPGDGAEPIGREDLAFTLDPRIDAALQTDDSVYKRNRLDRGHVARRADLLWGDHEEAVRANADSFFLTNITPQMDNFNQSALKGVWGRLENALLDNTDQENSRVSVMGGPVLADTDPPYRTVRVPLEFWKLLIYQVGGELRTRGFIVTQSLDGLKARDPFADFVVMEKTVDQIAGKAAVTFDDVLQDAQFRGRPKTRRGPREGVIGDTAQIDW